MLLCDLEQVLPLLRPWSLGKFGGGRCLQAFSLNGVKAEEKALGACLPCGEDSEVSGTLGH